MFVGLKNDERHRIPYRQGALTTRSNYKEKWYAKTFLYEEGTLKWYAKKFLRAPVLPN